MVTKPKVAKMPKPTTVDFETHAIAMRPAYPPIPVGVSIKPWKKPARYFSWGHPKGNNCTWLEAKKALEVAFKNPDGVLFQNGKFDIDVAEVHMGVQPPTWDKIHDTMYLLFLDSPHEKDLGLKGSAERLLNLPPDERDAVAEWLIENIRVWKANDRGEMKLARISAGRNSKTPAGAFIAFAPGDLVGSYANGDSDRTEAIFEMLWPKTQERKMLQAYDRERELMPILLNTERHGIRVDHERLKKDVEFYSAWMTKIDGWIRKTLNNPLFPVSGKIDVYEPLNIDSGDELAEALINVGKADPSLMGVTPTGKVQTNKEALKNGVTDKVMGAVLQYRAQLKTCLGTFLTKWLEMADQSGGYIFTNWNQVKAVVGTRTGRLSSTPNFQNMPKEFAALFWSTVDEFTKKLPKSPWKDLPPLPQCRSYIIAYTDDHLLAGRDYSQQEPRILAHFEDGALKEQYQANPWIDYHDNAKFHLEQIFKREFKRKPVKNINLGIIYGQGVPSLAEKNGETVEETKKVKDAIYALYPGLKDMYDDMKALSQANEPIRTWGGREYYCEPPAIIRGRLMTFDYKMVNVLIQGSAADCTKEAVIRFHRERVKRGKLNTWLLLLNVHDEIVLSLPKDEFEEGMEVLRVAMESVEFDVLILSEGAWSATGWADMKDYDKKGVRVDAFA